MWHKMLDLYKGKKVLLASMHKKELAIAKAFEDKLDCEIVVPENFNTDQFGTFSGEVERELSAYETLKKKAITAANIFNYEYVISSEGAFGPHPHNYFVNSDTEMLLFFDRRLDLFIADYEITTDTNFSEFILNRDVYNTDKYKKWLENVKFPSHGLIIKANQNVIHKGVSLESDLKNIVETLLREYDTLVLETDMRAMMNPTRMGVIKNLAFKLAKKVSSTCDKCSTPGFGDISYAGNLICELCHHTTKIPKFRDTKCLKCDYFLRSEIEAGKIYSDPRYCDYCNP